MIWIASGEKVLHQWDRGVVLLVNGMCSVVRVSREDDGHARELIPTKTGNLYRVTVPDSMLTESGYLRTACVVRDRDGERVMETARFIIRAAQKPSDYVHGAEDRNSWAALRLQVDAIVRAAREGKFDGMPGMTPHIGENGNWYLGEDDTGVKARADDIALDTTLTCSGMAADAAAVGAAVREKYGASNPPPYPVTSVNGKTGDARLTASDVGAISASTKIPAKTSDLINDTGFITRLVADLANYYAKTETYTRDEIKALVSAIPKFTISVVTYLPTTGISDTTVYLVKSGSGGDMYTEYIYVNGTWEILGSQRMDLTGYATEAWVNKKLEELLASDALSDIHIGPEPPVNGEKLWIDTDEDPGEESGGAAIDVTAEVGQTIIVKEVDNSGKPTKWEAADYQPRTHWTEMAELLPETTITFDEENGFAAAVDFAFVIGGVYRIRYNGTDYTCKAFELVEDGINTGVAAVGNGAGIGLDDTGEPFLAPILDGILLVMPYEELTEVKIRIDGEKVNKLDRKYYDGGVFWIDAVEVDGTYDGITVTPAQTQAAIDAGFEIKLRSSRVNNGITYTEQYPCVTYATVQELPDCVYQLVFCGKAGAIPKEKIISLGVDISGGGTDEESVNLPWVVTSGE